MESDSDLMDVSKYSALAVDQELLRSIINSEKRKMDQEEEARSECGSEAPSATNSKTRVKKNGPFASAARNHLMAPSSSSAHLSPSGDRDNKKKKRNTGLRTAGGGGAQDSKSKGGNITNGKKTQSGTRESKMRGSGSKTKQKNPQVSKSALKFIKLFFGIKNKSSKLKKDQSGISAGSASDTKILSSHQTFRAGESPEYMVNMSCDTYAPSEQDVKVIYTKSPTMLQADKREPRDRADSAHLDELGKLYEQTKAQLEVEQRKRSMSDRKVTALTKEKSALEMENIDLNAKLNDMEYRLGNEEEKFNHAKVLMNALKKQLSLAELKFIQELERQKKQTGDSADTRIAQLNEMKIENAKLKSELEKNRMDVKTLKSENAAKENKIVSLMQQHATQQEKQKQLLGGNQLETEEQLESYAKELEKMRTMLKSSADDKLLIQQNIVALTESLEKERAVNAKLTARNETSNKESNNMLRSDFRGDSSSQIEIKSRLDRLEAERELLIANLEEQTALRDNVLKDISRLEEKLIEMFGLSLSDLLNGKPTDIRTETFKQRGRTADLQCQTCRAVCGPPGPGTVPSSGSLGAMTSRLSKDLDEMRTQLRGVQQERDSLAAEVQRAREDSLLHQNGVYMTQTQLNDWEERIKMKYVADLNDKLREVNGFLSDNAQRQQSNKDNARQYNSMRIVELESICRQMEEKNRNLREQSRDLEARLDQFESTTIKQAKRIETLSEQLHWETKLKQQLSARLQRQRQDNLNTTNYQPPSRHNAYRY